MTNELLYTSHKKGLDRLNLKQQLNNSGTCLFIFNDFLFEKQQFGYIFIMLNTQEINMCIKL